MDTALKKSVIKESVVKLLTQALLEEPKEAVPSKGVRKEQPLERYPIARSQLDLVVEPVFDRNKRRETFAFTALSRDENGLLSSADVLGLLELLRVVASGYSEMPGESDMTRVVMDWLEKGIFDLQVELQKLYGMAKRKIVLPQRAA